MPCPGRDALVADLGAEVRGRQADQKRSGATVADLAGLHRTEWRCLDLVFSRGPLSAGEIAAALNVTSGAVTGVIDRLEAAGWVRRVRDTTDRRRVIVELTERIDAEAALVHGPLLAASAELFGRYADDELALLADFVRRERALLASHTERLRGMLGLRGSEDVAPSADRP